MRVDESRGKEKLEEGSGRSARKIDDVFLQCCPARPVSSDWDWRLLPGLVDGLWYRVDGE